MTKEELEKKRKAFEAYVIAIFHQCKAVLMTDTPKYKFSKEWDEEAHKYMELIFGEAEEPVIDYEKIFIENEVLKKQVRLLRQANSELREEKVELKKEVIDQQKHIRKITELSAKNFELKEQVGEKQARINKLEAELLLIKKDLKKVLDDDNDGYGR